MTQKILIVDDEKLHLHSLGELLTQNGHNIEAVNSGDMAIEKLRSNTFGILLPSASLLGARRVAEQLQLAIEQQDFNIDDEPVPVNVHTVARGRVEDTVVNSRAGTIKSRLRSGMSPGIAGLVAAIPLTWDPIAVYFGITVILSFLGWAGLARVVRGAVPDREAARTLATPANRARPEPGRSTGSRC